MTAEIYVDEYSVCVFVCNLIPRRSDIQDTESLSMSMYSKSLHTDDNFTLYLPKNLKVAVRTGTIYEL